MRTSTGARLKSTELEPGIDAELVIAHGDVVVLPPAVGASCATVLGDPDTLDTLERAGLIVRRDQRRPFQQLVETYTGLRTEAKRGRLRQMADKPVEGAYLKLTDESRRQLDAGQPVLARTGDLLGVVNDDHGRRRHMLRFENAITMVNPEFALAAATLQTVLGDLERRTRDSIEARRQELSSAGLLLRDIANPAARRWTDHLQQISRYKLSQKQPMVEALLAKHGDVFAPPAQISASNESDVPAAAFAGPGDRPTVLAALDDA